MFLKNILELQPTKWEKIIASYSSNRIIVSIKKNFKVVYPFTSLIQEAEADISLCVRSQPGLQS